MRFFRDPKSPYWWVDLRAYGKGRQSTGYADLARARQAVNGWILDKGLVPRRATGTLAELIARYLAFSEAQHTRDTYKRNKGVLRSFGTFLGDVRLEDVTTDRIEAYKAERGQQVKPGTVNRELITIKAMLNKAVDFGYLDRSPAVKVKKMREIRKQPRFYSRDEVNAILAASDPFWRRVWLLALNTGMRRGEIASLRWTDIKGNVIQLRTTKEGKEKRIPISEELRDVLGQMRKPGEAFVVGHQRYWLTHKFAKLVQSIGLQGSFHWLRHTVATHLLEQGTPIETVRELLGHANIATTSAYVHALRDAKEKAVNTLSWNRKILAEKRNAGFVRS